MRNRSILSRIAAVACLLIGSAQAARAQDPSAPSPAAPPSQVVTPLPSPNTPNAAQPADPAAAAGPASAGPDETPTLSASQPPPAEYAPPEIYRVPSARDRVVAYYTGLQLGISPGVIFPTKGGDPGFLLSVYGGYGFETGPVIIIPGIHVTGAWPENLFIGTVTPAVKLVYPLGAFAPYVEGGAGPGYVSDGKQWGAALRVEAGFSVHPSSRFAIGAGAAYETVTGTGISYLGPVLILSF